MNMSNEIVDRLLGSLSVLESAIDGARGALSKKSTISPEVMHRIDSYSDILNKQRQIAVDLTASVEASDWATVAQKVHLINSLLEMIRQDACEILRGLQGGSDDADDDSDPVIC